MNAHIQFAEDVDLLALGLLGEEDCAALRGHLETCAECRARFHEARALAALLALSSPPAEPSAGVRKQLLERLRAGRENATRDARAPKQEESRRAGFWGWTNLGWAVAAVILVAGAALMMEENRRVQGQVQSLQAEIAGKQQELDRTRAVLDLLRSTDTVHVHLISGSEPWPWPEGRVYYHPKKGLLFVGSHLPPLDPGMSYQLWCVSEGGTPASAGVFRPDAKGNAAVMMPLAKMAMSPKAFAVTVEADGGAQAPTGPQVMVGEQ
ncbi:MAG TPA: anti-sigma factor [Candidatus Acidoferrales bacterium]|nr:anti-sigma factor [Candidatus Acidoferrales bacterium]